MKRRLVSKTPKRRVASAVLEYARPCSSLKRSKSAASSSLESDAYVTLEALMAASVDAMVPVIAEKMRAFGW